MSSSSQRKLLCALSLSLPSSPKSFPSSPSLLLLLRRRPPPPTAPSLRFFGTFPARLPSPMSYTHRGNSAARERQGKQKASSVRSFAGGVDGGRSPSSSEPSVSSVAEGIGRLSLAENAGRGHPAAPMQFGGALLPNQGPAKGQKKGAWMPKTYVTASSAAAGPVEVAAAEPSRSSAVVEKDNSKIGGLTKLFKGPLGADFNVDNNTFSQAQIRATFYPKFENEKSDQEFERIEGSRSGSRGFSR